MIIKLFGPPGVGKTTIGKKLSLRKDIVFVDEKVEDNPYIKNSFNSSKEMLKSSLWFLNYFYSKNIEDNGKIIIYDQGIEELIAYNNALLKSNYLSKEDYLIFLNEYQKKITKIKIADLYIYYTVDIKLELERIRKRQREFESIYLNTGFILELRKSYQEFYDSLPKNNKLFILDNDGLGINLIINEIEERYNIVKKDSHEE